MSPKKVTTWQQTVTIKEVVNEHCAQSCPCSIRSPTSDFFPVIHSGYVVVSLHFINHVFRLCTFPRYTNKQTQKISTPVFLFLFTAMLNPPLTCRRHLWPLSLPSFFTSLFMFSLRCVRVYLLVLVLGGIEKNLGWGVQKGTELIIWKYPRVGFLFIYLFISHKSYKYTHL